MYYSDQSIFTCIISAYPKQKVLQNKYYLHFGYDKIILK